MNKKLIIAVDGFSSCGKSTLAKELAAKLGYIYIDSGAMYRAATLFAMENDLLDKTDELLQRLDEIYIEFRSNSNGMAETWLNNRNVEERIRQIDVSNNVSPISKIKEVRKKMVALQRALGENKGIVMDGRDIGTVVFPNADIKLFMTADTLIRAKRRYNELIAKGEAVTLEEVQKNIESRDHHDQNRKESPLKKADDAILLDNSNISREEQMNWVLDLIKNYNES